MRTDLFGLRFDVMATVTSVFCYTISAIGQVGWPDSTGGKSNRSLGCVRAAETPGLLLAGCGAFQITAYAGGFDVTFALASQLSAPHEPARELTPFPVPQHQRIVTIELCCKTVLAASAVLKRYCLVSAAASVEAEHPGSYRQRTPGRFIA
jgi:hypothetical protein